MNNVTIDSVLAQMRALSEAAKMKDQYVSVEHILLAIADDAVAIFGPGEEVHMEFEAPAEAPPAPPAS